MEVPNKEDYQESGFTPRDTKQNGQRSSIGQDDDENLENGELESERDRVLEVSPKGRFIRYNDELGSGAYKTVFRGLDNENGCEIAWNVIKLSRLPQQERKRIADEITLLKKLKHKNIINFISAWINRNQEEVIFITEIVTGGTLKQYLKRLKQPRLKVLKLWAREILSGLEYLHSQTPNPILHRDIKCDNIFINSNKGEIRIGDLGLATTLQNSFTKSILGTPEFMAPEIFEEHYSVGVDIYAFGMALLEMVTLQTPYRECTSTAQVLKLVMSRVKPACIDLIQHEELRGFILKCLSDAKERPSATELLSDPFFECREDDSQPVKLAPSSSLQKPLPMTRIEEVSYVNSSALQENGKSSLHVDQQINSFRKYDEQTPRLSEAFSAEYRTPISQKEISPQEKLEHPPLEHNKEKAVEEVKRESYCKETPAEQGKEVRPGSSSKVDEKRNSLSTVNEGASHDEEAGDNHVLFCYCNLVCAADSLELNCINVHLELEASKSKNGLKEDLAFELKEDISITLAEIRKKIIGFTQLKSKDIDRVILSVKHFFEAQKPLKQVQSTLRELPLPASSSKKQNIDDDVPTPEKVCETFSAFYQRYASHKNWKGMSNDNVLQQKQCWEMLELEKIHLKQRELSIHSKAHKIYSHTPQEAALYKLSIPIPNDQVHLNAHSGVSNFSVNMASDTKSMPSPIAPVQTPISPADCDVKIEIKHAISDSKVIISPQTASRGSREIENLLISLGPTLEPAPRRDSIIEYSPDNQQRNRALHHETRSSERKPMPSPLGLLLKGSPEGLDRERIKHHKKADPLFIESLRRHTWKSTELRRKDIANDLNDVRMIQACLNRLIPDEFVPENGLYGHFTETLVRKIQETFKLKPDGIVTQHLWLLMRDEIQNRVSDTRLGDQEKRRREKEFSIQKRKELQNKEAQAVLNQIESTIMQELNKSPAIGGL